MANAAVSFIRKNGKVIPIRAARAAGHVARAGAAAAVHGSVQTKSGEPARHPDKPKFKVNTRLDALGLGISIASGAIAAATFSTPKGFVAGHVAAHALDAAGVTANLASVTGKGNARERAKQGAKQELRNLVLGNLVYGAGVIAFKRNRAAAAGYAKKGIAAAGTIMELARRALRR